MSSIEKAIERFKKTTKYGSDKLDIDFALTESGNGQPTYNDPSDEQKNHASSSGHGAHAAAPANAQNRANMLLKLITAHRLNRIVGRITRLTIPHYHNKGF